MSVVKPSLKTNHDYDLALCLLSFIQFIKQINLVKSSRLGLNVVQQSDDTVRPSLSWVGRILPASNQLP